MQQPFVIFPWDKPFLPHLQEFICQTCQYDLGASVIVVPHNRPRRYLTELFCADRALPRPAMLPRMLTVGEMTGLFRAQAHAHEGGTRKASLLDSVHAVYRAAKVVESQDEGFVEHFSQKDLASFLPWGIRLVGLFEEYMHQCIPVHDILYAEGEVSPMAAELLGMLGRIHTAYVEILQTEGWTTAGLDAYKAAQYMCAHPDSLPALLTPHAQKNAHVFVAGFSTITQCEDTLLRALWQRGAHICLHTDAQVQGAQGHGDKAHYSCQDHVAWMKRWGAESSLFTQPGDKSAQMHFFAGYDVHSQLLHMQDVLRPVAEQYAKVQALPDDERLAQRAAMPSTAVVLSSTALLTPTLHHLPEMPFNISMGYPLSSSSFFALLEKLMRVQKMSRMVACSSAQGGSERAYHWRNVLDILRHPFVQLLSPMEPVTKGAQTLHSLLGKIEKRLRSGGNAFVSESWLEREAALQEDAQPEILAVFRALLPCLFTNFAHVQSVFTMGEALSALCEVLLDHGENLWKKHPLDAESLFRLMRKVIPMLKGAGMAQEPLPQKTLFTLVRQLMAAERVPFEAAPMEGLQVLGMLETRLLHFDKIVVLAATDDALPGFTTADPLLPDALRQVVGLPALQERERVVAHTLHRLLASAKEVHFCWQEGMQRSELFDAKKSRSRFVDAYLWKEEQERGYILENGMPPLQVAPCVISPMNIESQIIQAEPTVRQKIVQLLEEGISPTKLDTYLHCPQRFVWENIYKLRPLDEVNEGDDPAAVGKLLHKTLQEAYTPWKGQEMPEGGVSLEGVMQIFETLFENSAEIQALPRQSKVLLRMAAPVRFKRFLQAQAEQAPGTEIVALEEELLAPVEGRFGQTFHIKGVLDRVDTRLREYANDDREEGLVVLDYKTGKLPEVSDKVWGDADLWTDIGLWAPTVQNSHEILQRVAEAFGSVQLPCYIHMCQQVYGKDAGEDVLDAALVDLGGSGEEVYLLGHKVDMDTRLDIVEERVPQLVTFLLDHIYTAQSFPAHEGMRCKYCSYGALCKR